MKVLFYSPYIPKHFGGGEKHVFDVATTVAKKHTVFIAVPSIDQNKAVEIRTQYEAFLNYSLENITFIQSSLFTGSAFEKLKETSQYDYVYAVTDGSFFLSAAKKNNLHIQIPFTNALSFFDKIKLTSWNIKNSNSEFTKSVVEKSWRVKVDYVHHPLVSLEEIKPQKQKEKIILNVGRFFRQLHSKRQDILVSFFIELQKTVPEAKDWKLILVGSVEDSEYLEEVRMLAKGYSISILTDVSRTELISLYQKAAIYWHATGYGVDEAEHPEKVEHFGITTIEAMAAGCVPVVINKGGQKEIIGTELQQLLWDSQEDCLNTTQALLQDTAQFAKTQEQTLRRVQQFSSQEFEKVVWKMF